MLKKTVTYEDLNGNEVTETIYFNLSKPELVELEVSEDDGYSALLERIIETNDRRKQIAEFKRLILMTYGKKSEDGKRFIKSQELRDEFEQTVAFEQIFYEISTNAEEAAKFVNGIMPKGLDNTNKSNRAERRAEPKSKPEKEDKEDLRKAFAEFMKTREKDKSEGNPSMEDPSDID